MAEAAFAHIVGTDVVDDVVGPLVVTGHTTNSSQMIQVEVLPGEPSHHVVGAWGIATQSEASHQLSSGGIQSYAATGYIDSADLLANHWISRCSVRRRRSFVRDWRIDRITSL